MIPAKARGMGIKRYGTCTVTLIALWSNAYGRRPGAGRSAQPTGEEWKGSVLREGGKWENGGREQLHKPGIYNYNFVSVHAWHLLGQLMCG